MKGIDTRVKGSHLVYLIAVSSLLGCQTSRSWSQGCPGVYSGVRYYFENVSYLPVDEKIASVLDLPLSGALDTALLPATVFMKPKRPPHGFSRGCKWAGKH